MNKKSKLRKAKGFSLIELMLVLAISGVILSLALPSISDVVQKNKVRGAAREIRGTLVKARNSARTLQRCVKLSRVSSTQLRWVAYTDDKCLGTELPAYSRTVYFSSAVSIANFTALEFAPPSGGLRNFSTPQKINIQDPKQSFKNVESYTIYPAIGTVRGTL